MATKVAILAFCGCEKIKKWLQRDQSGYRNKVATNPQTYNGGFKKIKWLQVATKVAAKISKLRQKKTQMATKKLEVATHCLQSGKALNSGYNKKNGNKMPKWLQKII